MSEQSRYTPDNLGIATVRVGPKSRRGRSPYFVLPVLARHRLTDEANRVSVCNDDGVIVLRPGRDRGFVDYSAVSPHNIVIGAKACRALNVTEGDRVKVHDGSDAYRLKVVTTCGTPAAGGKI